MPTRNELALFRGLPLNIKIFKTANRINEFVNLFGDDGIYVSFSGGKDSTVLLDIVRRKYPNVTAVFSDTGLEYPEIRSFVKSFENVEIVRPKMRFDEVIKKYGYPMISKEVSQQVYEVRTYGKDRAVRTYSKFDPNSAYNKRYNQAFSMEKWKPLLDTDFMISHYCCKVMKKDPMKEYERRSGKHPIIATMTEEGRLRESEWLHNGCNIFEGKRPRSTPIAFWTEQDIFNYIKERSLEIASVYGEIVFKGVDELDYAQTLCECGGKYHTTGCHRTGCIFCGFGSHGGKDERFVRLKQTHPRQYEYCMGGGAYDTDGLWKPTKEGLGMAHVIDELNQIYGKNFIKY